MAEVPGTRLAGTEDSIGHYLTKTVIYKQYNFILSRILGLSLNFKMKQTILFPFYKGIALPHHGNAYRKESTSLTITVFELWLKPTFRIMTSLEDIGG